MSSPPDPIVVIGAGQSGLAAAHTLQAAGMPAVVLEAGKRPVGSWPDYYDSLTLFSPARYSELPGLPFPGDPEHYPTRDETIGCPTPPSSPWRSAPTPASTPSSTSAPGS